jgi:uncharacterized membrane protein YqjE
MGVTRDSDVRDRSVGELLKQLSEETSTLVRKEMELARAEISEQGKKAGAGAGLLGGGGVIALAAFLTLTATIVLLLDKVMDTWVAALIVTVVYAAIAGVLALRGRERIREATPPAPQTQETVKEDIEWAKTRK